MKNQDKTATILVATAICLAYVIVIFVLDLHVPIWLSLLVGVVAAFVAGYIDSKIRERHQSASSSARSRRHAHQDQVGQDVP